jgi:hypothetical protein
LLVLGHVATAKGTYDRAQLLDEESIAVHRSIGESWGLGIVLSAAAARESFGETSPWRACWRPRAVLMSPTRRSSRDAWSLEVFVGLLAAAGLADGAVRLWGTAGGLLKSRAGSLASSIKWIRNHYIERENIPRYSSS